MKKIAVDKSSGSTSVSAGGLLRSSLSLPCPDTCTIYAKDDRWYYWYPLINPVLVADIVVTVSNHGTIGTSVYSRYGPDIDTNATYTIAEGVHPAEAGRQPPTATDDVTPCGNVCSVLHLTKPLNRPCVLILN